MRPILRTLTPPRTSPPASTTPTHPPLKTTKYQPHPPPPSGAPPVACTSPPDPIPPLISWIHVPITHPDDWYLHLCRALSPPPPLPAAPLTTRPHPTRHLRGEFDTELLELAEEVQRVARVQETLSEQMLELQASVLHVREKHRCLTLTNNLYSDL